MNIQTEQLDNHTARMTVELDAAQLQQAREKAARKLSQRVRLPGFRPGKAPFKVVVRYFGEAAVTQEAIELISNDVYRGALESTDLDPYGPGQIEDYAVEPTPSITFVVPMQPTVDLKDYRSVRVEYQAPTVTDADVKRALYVLQEREAVIEESRQPAALGNRVNVNVHSHVVETDEAGESVEGPSFIHQHEMDAMLDAEREPVPGFAEPLVGVVPGDERTFTLVIPDDMEEYGEFAGKTVEFHVSVNRVEVVTLPVLNDDFAARVTQDEERPLTLLELRMRLRENIQQSEQMRAQEQHAQRVLDAIIAQAEVRFPEAMVLDEVEGMLQTLDQTLRRNRLTLDDYMKISGRTPEDLVAEYRPSAEERVRRSLVMREVMLAEEIQADEAAIDAEIERVIEPSQGEEREQMRALLNTRNSRVGITENFLRRRVNERLSQIGRGEAPERRAPVAVAASQAADPDETTAG